MISPDTIRTAIGVIGESPPPPAHERIYSVCTESSCKPCNMQQKCCMRSLPVGDGTSWSCGVWGSFHATFLLPSFLPASILYFSSISFLFVCVLAKLYTCPRRITSFWSLPMQGSCSFSGFPGELWTFCFSCLFIICYNPVGDLLYIDLWFLLSFYLAGNGTALVLFLSPV